MRVCGLFQGRGPHYCLVLVKKGRPSCLCKWVCFLQGALKSWQSSACRKEWLFPLERLTLDVALYFREAVCWTGSCMGWSTRLAGWLAGEKYWLNDWSTHLVVLTAVWKISREDNCSDWSTFLIVFRNVWMTSTQNSCKLTMSCLLHGHGGSHGSTSGLLNPIELTAAQKGISALGIPRAWRIYFYGLVFLCAGHHSLVTPRSSMDRFLFWIVFITATM